MDVRPAIPAAEFRSRIERVRREAGDRGLDGVLVWSRGGGAVDRCAAVLWLTNCYSPWLAAPGSQCRGGQSYAGVHCGRAAID